MLPPCFLFRYVTSFLPSHYFSPSWQISTLCNGVSGSVSPWVHLTVVNTTDPNVQYHNFCVITNDLRPNWYFESMTIMCWNNCVGYMGYTPQEISSSANSRHFLSIYDGLIYDLTAYVNYSPVSTTLISVL